jgi:hypothetical protein
MRRPASRQKRLDLPELPRPEAFLQISPAGLPVSAQWAMRPLETNLR